ncbi:MAG TPA: B12-binding domain-containing radical SAM protein [Mesotoga sp.]|nr:B12-binding domain-containing radical SAM protein [Mesotoga sp.]HOY26283.1 B12-binding domain-containing radical SAM protein [Mesotoga sp.]HQC56071.1 B12-binding domain-containing radical SAM protein [Mesotoga sp.]
MTESRKAKRILLVNPWIEDVSAYDYWLKPVGLLYISSILKDSGIEPVLVDCLDRYDADFLFSGGESREKYFGTGKFHEVVIPKPESMKDIPRKFKRFGIPEELLRMKLRSAGDVAGVFVTSMMTYWYTGVVDTIRVIHEELPAARIVLGGVYATLLPDHAAVKCGADFLCPGTGVAPVKRALEYLGIDVLPREDWFTALDPDYSHYTRLPYAVLMTSLGCPLRCTYCASGKLWKGFLKRDPLTIADSIERLTGRDETEDMVFFDDAILFGDFKTLLKELSRRKIVRRFHLPNGVHARLLDVEMAGLLYDNNFKTIKLGLETSDPSMQLSTGGKVTNEDFFRAVKNLADAGFTAREMSAYIMLNLPGQKVEDVERSLEKCGELGVYPSLNEFTPIPGTVQWRTLIEDDLFDEEIDPLLLDNSMLPHWWKGGMNASQVQALKEMEWKVRRSLDGK